MSPWPSTPSVFGQYNNRWFSSMPLSPYGQYESSMTFSLTFIRVDLYLVYCKRHSNYFNIF